MAAVPVYVEEFPEREAVLHPEGAEIELTPDKEEELTSVSEGEETEEESLQLQRENLLSHSQFQIEKL